MIAWLHSLDAGVFRFINHSLGNPLFDRLMPFLSDSPFFPCAFLLTVALLAWKGGARGRICAFMLVASMALGNWLVCDSIKYAVARARPFVDLTDAIVRNGKGASFSMPSSHAANWFGAAMVFFVYFRRSIWFMLPLALLVAFSRVYNGVHYPTDVLAGALLGAGYGAAVIWACEAFWQWLGPKWFPIWNRQLPSIVNPAPVPAATGESQAVRDAQWVRLGYLAAILLAVVRLTYLASAKIELSEDEAYQWLWSKHPALSYYSKPAMIAYTQFLGTRLWGDNGFGVRFFSPVISLALSFLLLRFMARHVPGKTAFVLLLIMTATPLLSLGAIVMTVDPLSVLFWTAAMIAGWNAAEPNGKTRHWLWVGLWMGLGLLSKYTNLVQLACWAVFFLLWPAARIHLRRPGPWLALGIVAVCSLPVLIWNSQHNWITVAHVASDGQFDRQWHRTYVGEFLMLEPCVLNPVFFIAALWAAIAFWREGRRDPFQLYLFSMGAPLFLMYFALSFHNRVLLNWIVPSVIPLFCLMAVYWTRHWRQNRAILEPCLALSVGIGLVVVVFAHSTVLVSKLLHRRLPPPVDPLHRVHGWKETAAIVGSARDKLAAEGKPAFIICDHYGMTGQISFYLPEAKRRVTEDPLVYFRATKTPENQFYFWPNYLNRAGQNAIFVIEAPRMRMQHGWIPRWWKHETNLFTTDTAAPPVPPEIRGQFQSVENLGITNVLVNGEVVRRLQLYACLGLKSPAASLQ